MLLKIIIFLLSIVNFIWLSETQSTCDDNNIINDNFTISAIYQKYKNGENVNEIFKWIDSCKSIENQIIGYRALYNEIAERDEKSINNWTLKFAKVLEENLLHIPYKITDKKAEKYHNLLLDLYEEIPNCVVILATGEDILVKSLKYNEHLIASEIKENHDRRNVFFTEENYVEAKWKPKIDEEEYGAFLVLKNVYYDETLIVSERVNLFKEHVLYTKAKADKKWSQWILESADEFGDECLLYNPKWNQYLCVYEEDFHHLSQLRRVYTANKKLTNNRACHFSIEES